MALPLGASHEIARYVIRSKDRTVQGVLPYTKLNGPLLNSPHDFTVAFQTPFTHDVPEFYIKVKSVSISNLPQGEMPTTQGAWGLDTKACVDVCLSNPAFKSGVDTDRGQAEKTSSEKTLVLVPITSWTDSASLKTENDDWILIANNGNMSNLRFKLFNDAGVCLGTRTTGTLTQQTVNWNCPGLSGYYQQLTIPTGAVVALRGDILNHGGSVSEIIGQISGQITILSVVGLTGEKPGDLGAISAIVIGFPYQRLNIPAATYAISWKTHPSGQRIIDDWAIELQISSAKPDKRTIRPL